MKPFRTLDLAIQYYESIVSVPLPHHLKEQLLRSASSVALNLSEGNAKLSYKDKKRIFQIALGSFRESQTILKLGGYRDPNLDQLADYLGGSLYKLTVFKSPAISTESGS